MKHLSVILVLFALSFGVFADARIEVTDNFCHAPWDETNVDNEFYISGCQGVINVTNGAARGWANVKHTQVSASMVPAVIDPRDTDEYPTGRAGVSVSGATTGATCVMVDSNGTTYVSNTWDVVNTAKREQERWLVAVEHRIECYGGVAQAN